MEQWKTLKEIQNYEVSNLGRIRTKKTGRIRKLYTNHNKYLRITFSHKNITKLYFIHVLVAKAFIKNSNNKPHVNHKDCNKLNNHVENLEWVSHKENMIHAHVNGCFPEDWNRKGKNACYVKLSEKQVLEIRKKYKTEDVTYQDLAKIYNVTKSCINNIVNKRNWKHI